MNRAYRTTLLLLSAVPIVALAAPKAAPLPVTAFDIAGVKLGMTQEQARAALMQSGYKIGSSAAVSWPLRSWEQRLQAAVLRRQGKSDSAVGTGDRGGISGSKERRQEVNVHFAARPEGFRVVKVEYEIATPEIRREDYDSNVVSKYGRPHAVLVGGQMRWCSTGEARCLTYNKLKRPNLESGSADIQLERKLVLDGNDDAEEARLKAMFAAELERRAPPTRETAF